MLVFQVSIDEVNRYITQSLLLLVEEQILFLELIPGILWERNKKIRDCGDKKRKSCWVTGLRNGSFFLILYTDLDVAAEVCECVQLACLK